MANGKALYLFQSWVSLVVHVTMIGLNVQYGWASEHALYWTAHLIVYYEIFDLFLGWESYWYNDKMIILHHVATAWGGKLLLDYLGSGDEELIALVSEVMYWALLSEVTTIFNSVRIILSGFGGIMAIGSKAAFAGAFCLLRSIQTVGMAFSIMKYWTNDYFGVCFRFWLIYTVLNVMWMKGIVDSFRKHVANYNAHVVVMVKED